MLYKNDEKVDLSEEMKQLVYKDLGAKSGQEKDVKFPVVIKMPEYMYTAQRPGSKNTKPDRPASANIRLDAALHDKEGSAHWNYCTGRRKAATGEKWIYFSNDQGVQTNVLSFTDTHSIGKDKIDLLYFLLFLSPLRFIPNESAEHRIKRGVKASSRFQFVVENKEQESMERVSKKQQKLRIDSVLMGDNCMSIDKLRIIAASLHIDNAEGKGEFELRDEVSVLVDAMERSKKTGYDTFEQLAKMDDNTNIKATIQKAIDMKLVRHDIKNNAFVYVKDGKNANKITGVVSNKSLRESLEWFMENHPNNFAELEMVIREAEALVEA